jgi:hypothetical protein
MTIRTIARLALLCGALAACAHAPAAGAVSLRVDSNVPDATVWIDDVLAGKASDFASGQRRVRAGFHRVEVRSPGYYSVFQEIEQPAGGSAVVGARLRPLLD